MKVQPKKEGCEIFTNEDISVPSPLFSTWSSLLSKHFWSVDLDWGWTTRWKDRGCVKFHLLVSLFSSPSSSTFSRMNLQHGTSCSVESLIAASTDHCFINTVSGSSIERFSFSTPTTRHHVELQVYIDDLHSFSRNQSEPNLKRVVVAVHGHGKERALQKMIRTERNELTEFKSVLTFPSRS